MHADVADRADAAEGLLQVLDLEHVSCGPTARALFPVASAPDAYFFHACTTNPSSPLRRPSAKMRMITPEDQAVVFGHLGDEVVQHQQQRCTDQRPEKDVDAAEHDHEHRFARNGPVRKIGIGARYEEADEHSADPAEHTRDDEGQHANAPDLDAEKAGAARIVADHPQRIAERRLHQVPHQEQRDDQRRAAEQVQMVRIIEPHAEEGRPRHAAGEPLIPAGDRRPGDDQAVQQHLEGERQEREVDLLEAHADRADHRRDQRVDHNGQRKRHRDRGPQLLHQEGKAVGAQPEEQAMAE